MLGPRVTCDPPPVALVHPQVATRRGSAATSQASLPARMPACPPPLHSAHCLQDPPTTTTPRAAEAPASRRPCLPSILSLPLFSIPAGSYYATAEVYIVDLSGKGEPAPLPASLPHCACTSPPAPRCHQATRPSAARALPLAAPGCAGACRHRRCPRCCRSRLFHQQDRVRVWVHGQLRTQPLVSDDTTRLTRPVPPPPPHHPTTPPPPRHCLQPLPCRRSQSEDACPTEAVNTNVYMPE